MTTTSNFYFVSRPDGPARTFPRLQASVGGGKTHAARMFMLRPANLRRNFLYIAPTKALINDTYGKMMGDIRDASGPLVRNAYLVRRINEDTTEDGELVRQEALEAINAVNGEEGIVLMVTTATFLGLAAKVRRPELWTVFLDEAFEPATFTDFGMGDNVQGSWDHFSELFDIDARQGHRIVPREGKRTAVQQMAEGDFSSVGDRFRSLEPVARAAANPALRCEMVLTPIVEALMRGEPAPLKRSRTDPSKAARAVLQFSTYVSPDAFVGFREVFFLCALFEETVLFHLWAKALGVTFTDHPDFPVEVFRNLHKTQGRFMQIGHLLHPDDAASIENLKKDATTGEDGGPAAGRVIHQLIKAAAEHFDGADFLLQVNRSMGYAPDKRLPYPNARLIPAFAHGLNTYGDTDNIAALCVTNPTPLQRAWVMERTGMTSKAVGQAFRVQSLYQGVGRCSIRNAERALETKRVLVAGLDDALFLHRLFEGSTFLGQVGSMRSLRRVSRSTDAKPLGRIEATARAIRAFLERLGEETQSIGSKTIKAALCSPPCTTSLKAKENDCTVDPLSPRAWAIAVDAACASGTGWKKVGQALVRVSAADYGFLSA